MQSQSFSGGGVGQVKRQSLSMADHLRSTYLGTTVTFEREAKPKQEVKKDVDKGLPTLFGSGNNIEENTAELEAGLTSGEVVSIQVEREGYRLVLDTDEVLKVTFTVSNGGDLRTAQQASRTYHNLQVQRLKTEEFLNMSLAKVGNPEAKSSGALLSDNYEQLMQNKGEDFTSGEEIIYTDKRTNRKKKAFVFVSHNGLYLEDGSVVSIELVNTDE